LGNLSAAVPVVIGREETLRDEENKPERGAERGTWGRSKQRPGGTT